MVLSEKCTHTDTHTETHQVHVVWTTPLKEFFLLSLVSEVKKSGISTLSPFFFLFYRSDFYCYSVQNIRGCKMQKWKKEKDVNCHVVLVVCVSRRVFGVPA